MAASGSGSDGAPAAGAAPALRDARPDDVPALRRLYDAAVRALGPARYAPDAVASWAAFSDDDRFPAFILDAHTLVAEDATGPVGFAGVDDDGLVASLYVRPDRARQGIGALLLGAVLERAAARGVRRFETRASALARPLFERFGFTVVAPEVVERGGARVERYIMARAPK